MSSKKLFCAIIIIVVNFANANPTLNDEPKAINDRVIIGVLAQYPYKDEHQFIAASYVKFLESSGARVIPVFSGHPYEYYDELLKKINGMLLPGGGSPLDQGPYADAVEHIFKVATKLNQNGTNFPIWATCLSFEMMIIHYLGNRTLAWESLCYVNNISLNLDLVPEVLNNATSFRLFRQKDELMPNLFEVLQTKNVTPNYHRICMSVDEWNKHHQLTDQFRLVSTNTFKNHTFVSMVEHKKYPFFGSMWHPEKNQFEFVINNHVGNIVHDKLAVAVSQYFANVFVDEARRNCQHFQNKLEESEHLIYNYNKYREYTGKKPTSSFEEVFKFPTDYNFNSGTKQGCFSNSFLVLSTTMIIFIIQIYL